MSSLNIIKKYPELLELAYLSEREREHDLHAIYNRQIKKFPTEKQNVSLKHILT